MTIFDALLRPLERGIVLKEEYLTGPQPFDPALCDALLSYRPTVVVHRGGNGPSRFQHSIDAGATVLETDVHWRRGNLVIGHEHWVGPIAFDTTRRLLRLDPRARPLRLLLDQALPDHVTLLLDFKLGTLFARSRTEVVASTVLRRMLEERTWFTGDWSALDVIATLLPSPMRYYGVGKPSRLQRFLREQPSMRRPGISLNKRLATPETVEALHTLNVDVLAYTVYEAEEAIQLLEAGVDGLITNNLSLVQLFAEAVRS